MKMILAIINKDDELETVNGLNQNNFFVTKLSTSGGFLKSKNTTLLIGTEDERVQDAIDVVKKYAGERKTIKYTNLGFPGGPSCEGVGMSIPLDVEVGGCTIFVLNIEQFEKI